MTNDLMLGSVYLLMAIMLVAGGLMARREPLAKLLTIGACLGCDLCRRVRPVHLSRQSRLGRAEA